MAISFLVAGGILGTSFDKRLFNLLIQSTNLVAEIVSKLLQSHKIVSKVLLERLFWTWIENFIIVSFEVFMNLLRITEYGRI